MKCFEMEGKVRSLTAEYINLNFLEKGGNMKLTEKQLCKLRKISDRVSVDTGLKVTGRLKSKGLISGRAGFLFITEKGQKELEKRFGNDF